MGIAFQGFAVPTSKASISRVDALRQSATFGGVSVEGHYTTDQGPDPATGLFYRVVWFSTGGGGGGGWAGGGWLMIENDGLAALAVTMFGTGITVPAGGGELSRIILPGYGVQLVTVTCAVNTGTFNLLPLDYTP